VQVPEVIEVGLNGIREVCSRTANVLQEEELADLAGFRKFKHKGVGMACRSLINLYREKDPELLHRSIRGRIAAMAISRGEVVAEEYGKTEVYDTIEGLDLLLTKKLQEAAGEDEDGLVPKAKAAKDDATTKVSARETRDLITDKVLSEEDFKKLRKLRLQKSIELQLGRKRKAEEMSSSSSSGSGSDSDSESSVSSGERGLAGRMPGAISAAELKAKAKRARTKAERLTKIKEGRMNHKEIVKKTRQERKGGRTNAENKRKKPLMMSMQSQTVRKKKGENAKEKLLRMKKHVKRLRNTTNHLKIARRAP